MQLWPALIFWVDRDSGRMLGIWCVWSWSDVMDSLPDIVLRCFPCPRCPSENVRQALFPCTINIEAGVASMLRHANLRQLKCVDHDDRSVVKKDGNHATDPIDCRDDLIKRSGGSRNARRWDWSSLVKWMRQPFSWLNSATKPSKSFARLAKRLFGKSEASFLRFDRSAGWLLCFGKAPVRMPRPVLIRSLGSGRPEMEYQNGFPRFLRLQDSPIRRDISVSNASSLPSTDAISSLFKILLTFTIMAVNAGTTIMMKM